MPIINHHDSRVIYSRNLTMDKGTGIGKWSEEDFVKAVKTDRTEWAWCSSTHETLHLLKRRRNKSSICLPENNS
jgi:hypothetical protein